jgi:16S rRNA (guanine966-N2)-methyltransferase
MTGRIRIISGQWRGRKVEVLDSPGLRPTGDRARETLFNWLGPSIHGQRCLDLFAGSGVLGLEAASRGAARVVMLELDRRAADHLRSQVRTWPDQERLEIHQADALEWIERGGDRYDLVFVDPPHGRGLQAAALRGLLANRLLGPDARVYVESGRDEAWDEGVSDWVEAHFELIRSRRVGQVELGLYRPSAL